MRLTPLDIREQQFRRVMRGLDPEEVDHFLETVAGEFESLVASNNELRQKVMELEEKIVEYKSMEKALRDALLAAEKVMGEAREGAQREAALIVREAEFAAERAKGRLGQDLQRLREDIAELRRLKDAYVSRVRWLLRAHLEMLDGQNQDFEDLDASLAPLAPSRPTVAPASPEPPAGARAGSPPEARLWQQAPLPAPEWPSEEATVEELDDVLRPISPDGSYEPRPGGGTVAPRPSSVEEIAQAARRAERLAAEARAAFERHAARAPDREPSERGRDESGPPPV